MARALRGMVGAPRSPVLPLLALALILTVLCTGPACYVPGRIKPTVKIGLVAPFEGRYRAVGYDVIYAVRLALREANGRGGVAGYGVELIAYDDGADPEMAVEQARKLALDPGVLAVIGHFREETTVAAIRTYTQASLPLVAPVLLAPSPSSPLLFRMGPDAQAIAGAMLSYVEEIRPPVQRAVLVTEGGPLGVALQELAHTRGLSLHLITWPADGDWTAQVLEVDVAVVLFDTTPVEAGEIAAALRAAGWEGAFVGGPELAAADFAAIAERAAEGAVFVTPWPLSVSDTEFVQGYGLVSGGMMPGPLAVPAYEATWVVLEALEREITASGKPGRAEMAVALAATRRTGLLGEVTFGPTRRWDGAPLYRHRKTG
ncbi:MAG: branched-chain amino acid ABC transporter substrate-binding protein [Anaerolineae bacterium]|nr:branched-chain amino acid ABC transporter substrate-binding protein [Anaerolineae bacterium]